MLRLLLGYDFIGGLDNGLRVQLRRTKTPDCPEDDRMLNDILFVDQLPDFRLGTRAQVSHPAAEVHPSIEPATEVHPSTESVAEGYNMNTSEPSTPKEPPIPKDLMQQLLGEVRPISEQQSQLQSQFTGFQLSVHNQ